MSLMAQSASTNATGSSSKDLTTKLERDARVFLEEIVGIDLRGPGLSEKRPWTCLSCLLSQVYNLFCKAGPEGDADFFREVQRTKFE